MDQDTGLLPPHPSSLSAAVRALPHSELISLIERARKHKFSERPITKPTLPQKTSGVRAFKPVHYADNIKETMAPENGNPISTDKKQPETEGASQNTLPPAQHDAPPPQTKSWEEGYQAGLAEAHILAKKIREEQQTEVQERNSEDIGTKAVIQEKEIALQTAVELFTKASQILTENEKTLAEHIAQSLSDTIKKIASERAGHEITENPAPFVARIEKLADRIAQGMHNIKLALNPEDLDIIKAHSKTLMANNETSVQLMADASLIRGDIIVRGCGVILEDRLIAKSEKAVSSKEDRDDE